MGYFAGWDWSDLGGAAIQGAADAINKHPIGLLPAPPEALRACRHELTANCVVPAVLAQILIHLGKGGQPYNPVADESLFLEGDDAHGCGQQPDEPNALRLT